MANDQKQIGAGTFLVLPAFLAWALVAVGIVVTPPALRTARPGITGFEERPTGGAEHLAARLWQDPLRTAYEAHQRAKPKTTEAEVALAAVKLAAQAAGETPPPDAQEDKPVEFSWLNRQTGEFRLADGPALVLAVLLPGAPYADDAENRLRMRYAVLSGLHCAGYVPEDRNHIGYFTMPCSWRQDFAGGPTASGEMVVPFEWHYNETGRNPGAEQQPEPPTSEPSSGTASEPRGPWKHVLVLWIDESQLGRKPLKALGVIGEKVIAAAHAQSQPASKPAQSSGVVHLKILGPTNSNVLSDMLFEYAKDSTPLPPMSDAWIYSPRATISEQQLDRALRDGGVSKPAADLLGELRVRRVIADDECVCNALVRELARRKVSRSEEGAHVALVAEWDTAYGRALPKTFRDCYLETDIKGKSRTQGRGAGDDDGTRSDEGRNGPAATQPAVSEKRVLMISYMQGIDGRLPGAQPTLRDDSPERNAVTERPEGEPQLDYLRRLEQQLKCRDARLWKEGGGRLRAIGILGSDVYDKLLILRALRPSFPGVVFFTTDLDARLLQPGEQKWTRNLVVASAFGLQLERKLQQKIPPFRGSYQTAQFQATLQLLGENSRLLAIPTPRVFEIGRHAAYDLSPSRPRSPHPMPPCVGVRWDGWLCGGVVLASLVLLLLIAHTVRAFVRWMIRCVLERPVNLLFPAAALTAVAALIIVIWEDHHDPEGEPFAVFEGISVWPTELLRVLAILISCGLIRSVWVEFGKDTDDIERLLSPPAKVRRSWGGAALNMGRGIAYIFEYKRRKWRSMRRLWWEYHKRRVLPARLTRTALFLGFFFLLMRCIMALCGQPGAPGRNGTSFLVDKIVIFASVAGMLLLLFLVLQRTQLCAWLIRQMDGDEPIPWPWTARAQWARRCGLPSGHPGPDVDEWLSVRLIAAHTASVGKFILYPFAILFIMVVARHQVFDQWDWPPVLVGAVTFVFVLALYASVVLRRSARKLRDDALQRVRRKAVMVRDLGDIERAGTLQQVAADIKAERGGAYSSLLENPVFHALLIPSGGLGTLAVIEYLLGGL